MTEANSLMLYFLVLITVFRLFAGCEPSTSDIRALERKIDSIDSDLRLMKSDTDRIHSIQLDVESIESTVDYGTVDCYCQ